MSFENIKTYQKDVVRLIDNSYSKDRLAPVYLFSGPRGTGKMEGALYLAMKLLCKDGGCEECESCKRVVNKTNEHVHIVSVDDGILKKDQILELIDEFTLTSDSPEIFIIDGVEKANERSANSLLKFLEELHGNAYGILISEDTSHVLSTIKSRCQIVHFNPINKNIVKDELVNKGISKEVANIISFITYNKDKAIEYARDENILSLIELVKDINVEIENDGDPMLQLEGNGRMLFDNGEGDLNNLFFEMLIAYQRDKIEYLSNNNTDGLCFSESIKSLNISKIIEEEIDILDILLKHKDRLLYFVNKELMYSSMFIEIKRC